MLASTHPVRRTDLETHILPDGSCLIFDATTNQGRALNAGGSLVWDYCDGALDAEGIAGEVAALFADGAPTRQAALQLLDELDRLGFFAAPRLAGAGAGAMP
ncbi:MAG TPA: PqqD family protein [Ktedonobacterales bacterium]|jgi:hypothetical protein